MRISFTDLAAKIARPKHSLKAKARLRIPASPDPFVSPDFRVIEGDESLAAEIVFIEASAAVGKTTTARALSALTGAPLLDLTEVPVSTQSLMGLLRSDFSGSGDPVQAFQTGEIPLIVDALDEGRMLSGDQGFEQFLVTTAELLNEARSEMSRPKLVFMGRPDTMDLAKLGLDADHFRSVSVEVDFFGEEPARKLIDAYARSAASADAAYHGHPIPVRQVVDAYFEAIESALGLAKGTLWSSEPGRAFGGYAPVLAALGSMLAKIDNFAELRSQLLAAGGAHRAWSVIEAVLEVILDREQGILTGRLSRRIAGSVPPEAYDRHEQLTLLAQLIQGRSLAGSGRVRLAAADQSTYQGMVEQRLPEHPFVRQGAPGNAVLGSVICAHAVYNDLFQSSDLALAGDLSRQPFLWRSLSGMLERAPTLLDGRYLGFALNSLWNDPVWDRPGVVIRSTTEESEARVFVPFGHNRTLSIAIALPLWLYGQVRHCSIDVTGEMQMHGQPLGSSGASFAVRGPVDVICGELRVESAVVSFEGRTWFEAGNVTWRAPKPRVQLRAGGEVGWGGILQDAYPWRGLRSTVDAPYATPPGDLFGALIEECWRRLPLGGAITLNTDYSNPEDDRLRWVDRNFQGSFPKLIELTLGHDLASAERLAAKGVRKLRIRFQGDLWEHLRRAVHGEATEPKYTAFVQAARRLSW